MKARKKTLLILFLVSISTSGCGQGVDRVSLSGNVPGETPTTNPTQSLSLLGAINFQGSPPSGATSTSLSLGIQAAGGPYSRTKSLSSHYMLTGQIGIE